jgi:hypothetical protein
LERLRSWYKYRRRLAKSDPNSTVSLSFSDFVEAVIEPDPPPCADVGDQSVFTSTNDGSLGINHLFLVEAPAPFHAFLRDQFGDLPEFDRRNESPPANTLIPPALEERLHQARALEFDLYDRVQRAGGYLFTPLSPRSAGVR